ncbi:MAG: hypothetical protein ACRYF0_05150 [Janthinobacterium lividum]
MENLAEPERPNSDSTLGRFALVNGLLLGLVALLMLAAGREEGYLGGLGEVLAIFGLMGLGTLLNLVLAGTTKGSRVGYLLMAALYGAVFFYLGYAFAHMGKLNPGG